MKNIAISLFLLCPFLFGKNDATGQMKDKPNIEKPKINFILTDHWRCLFMKMAFGQAWKERKHEYHYIIQSA